MTHVGIIGGGIIGLSSAYYLHQAGHRVTVFDQNRIAGTPAADGCSFGNAGMIVPSHIIPLAQPGMIAKGLRWMLRPDSPFYVKPRLNADLLRWGWLFYRHANAGHVERAIPALRDISLLSKKLYQELARPVQAGPGLAAAGEFEFGWQERGLLMLYKTPSAEHELAEEAEVANRAGVEARMLTGVEVQDLEPDVRVAVRGAVYYPGDAHLNPGELIRALVTYLRQAGVQFVEEQTVTDFGTQGDRLTEVRTAGECYAVDEVIVAGGAWSPGLANKLGVRLPLQGGKGYSFMLNGLTPNVRVPAIMLEARATATPMGSDLRFAGTLEVAGTDQSVNMNRVRGIVESINQYYPDIPVVMPAVETVWKGLRPCSPDGLPYIGRAGRFHNLIIATGHGMMGLSLGPVTGKLVAEVLSGQPTSVNLDPFRPDRFSR